MPNFAISTILSYLLNHKFVDCNPSHFLSSISIVNFTIFPAFQSLKSLQFLQGIDHNFHNSRNSAHFVYPTSLIPLDFKITSTYHYLQNCKTTTYHSQNSPYVLFYTLSNHQHQGESIKRDGRQSDTRVDPLETTNKKRLNVTKILTTVRSRDYRIIHV